MTGPPPEPAQPLVGFHTNEEWQNSLAQVATLIEHLERIEDPEIHRMVFATLQAIDAVHREALHRLVRLFKEGVLDQIVTDPAIHTLMGMYNLLPAKVVSDRKVVDFLTAEERAASPRRPVASTLAVSDPQPHWARVPLDQVIANGDAVIFEAEEGAVVIAKVETTLYAVDAICPTHSAIMTGGALKGFSWLCPHGPGCVYDIRNGSRLGGGAAIAAHPVRTVDGGGVQIGFGIPYEPKLPAF